MNRSLLVLPVLVALFAGVTVSSADTASPPGYCTDASGVRYPWSSDQCAQGTRRVGAGTCTDHAAPRRKPRRRYKRPARPVSRSYPRARSSSSPPRYALSSYGASAGEKIRYTVVNDVVINGMLVAKAGDSAVGQVQEAQRGKNTDLSLEYQAADLRVSVDSIYNYCGDTISVLFDRVEYRRRQGVFGSNADITIKQGQQYAAIVDHPQKICATTTTEDPPDART